MNISSEPESDADAAPVIDHAPLEAPAEAQTPPPPPPPPVPARARERRNGGGAGSAVLLSFILFGLLAAGGYYAWTNPSPQMQQKLEAAAHDAQAASDQAGTLSQQLAALSARVEKLESAPAPAPAAPAASPDLGDLPKRVDDLAAKVDALANRPEPAPAPAGAPAAAPAPDNAAAQQAVADLSQRTSQAFDAQRTAFDQLGARVDQLGTRVAALEHGVGVARGTAATTVRLTRIEAALLALQTGQPLGDIPGAPAALTRFAKVAPPTEAELREEFPALAAHAQAVSEPDLSGRSFWQRALTRLQSAVTIREGGDVLVGDPASGILSDARTRILNGDVAGAVDVLHKLTGPAAAAMRDWMDQAEAVVSARAALADMAAHT